MTKSLLLGASLGAAVGLALWLRAIAGPPAATPVAARPTPASPAATLGASDKTDAEARPPESPRAKGVRYLWTARALEGDYDGALEVVASTPLDESERTAQYYELADQLAPLEWVNAPSFPRVTQVDALMRRPSGPADLANLWRVANAAVDRLPAEPRKVGFLARLELLAFILEAAAEAKDPTGLAEVSEPGRANEPAAAKPFADLRFPDERARLRRLASEQLAGLSAQIPGGGAIAWIAARWGFVQTLLLMAVGAMTTAAGEAVLDRAWRVAGRVVEAGRPRLVAEPTRAAGVAEDRLPRED